MRAIAVALLALSPVGQASAFAQPPAPAATSHYTTASTDIGTLLDDPVASAVVDKYIPDFSTNPQTSLVRTMTLKQVQVYSPATITDSVLVKIDAELAKLPTKK